MKHCTCGHSTVLKCKLCLGPLCVECRVQPPGQKAVCRGCAEEAVRGFERAKEG